MPGPTALPRQNGELVFEAPWQARAFGLAVALHERQAYQWDEFRERLAAALGPLERAADPTDYYQRWLTSLEALLLEKRLLAPDEIATRQADLASSADEH